MNEKSKELRAKFANLFVNSLNDNPKAWRKEWFSIRGCFNPASKTDYRGFNRVMLTYLSEQNGWGDPRFFTFKQASEKGYKIPKGTKGSPVEFWSPYDYKRKKTLTWSEFSKYDEADRDNVTLLARTYTVFNASQLEGVPEYKDDRATNVKPNEAVLKMADSMGVKVVHGGNRAFYRPSTDEVHMPKANQFSSDEAYAATLAHELAHASGAKHRLDRTQSNEFGDEDYAREELVAEITACYICSELGIEMTDDHIDNHQAYVQHWAQQVKDDPEALTRAVKGAEDGADYMMVHAGLMSKADYEKLHKKEFVNGSHEAVDSDFTEDDAAMMTREELYAEGHGMIYVPPHFRKGNPVKGYYRKKK